LNASTSSGKNNSKKRLLPPNSPTKHFFEDNRFSRGFNPEITNSLLQKISADLLIELTEYQRDTIAEDIPNQKVFMSDLIKPKNIYQTILLKHDILNDKQGYLSLHASPLEDSPHQSNSDELLKTDVVRAMNNYKFITAAMEKILKDPRSTLYIIKHRFVSYFIKEYEPVIVSRKEMKINTINFREKAERCLTELKDFINTFQETSSLYFGLSEIRQERNKVFSLLTKENLINFITTQLFTDEVYYIIYEIYKLINPSQEERLRKGLLLSSRFTLNEFGVSAELCSSKKISTLSKAISQTLSENEENFYHPLRHSYGNHLSKKAHKTDASDLCDSFSCKEIGSSPRESPHFSSELKKRANKNFTKNLREALRETSVETSDEDNTVKKFLINGNDPRWDFSDDVGGLLDKGKENIGLKADHSSDSFFSIPGRSEVSNAGETNFQSCIGDGLSQASVFNINNGNHFNANSKGSSALNQKLRGTTYGASDSEDCDGYVRAIMSLRNIQFLRAPIQKLKALANTSDFILRCANDIYNHRFEEKRLISPAEFLRLMTFVVANSNVKSLAIHLAIMEDFSTRNIMTSAAGHYLVILHTCISLLEEMGEKGKEDGLGFSEALERCFEKIFSSSGNQSHQG
jgi:hypothetical protein